ncbi:helix-turn-helix domain-containing protein [Bradyrhizobium sp. TZ2]
MRAVADWDEGDLLALISAEVQESLTLDYKRSAALGKGSNERNSLSKDVSSFANSEGGLLIYGMEENGHAPTAIDGGTDRTQITKEWLESVVRTTIHPNLDALLIKQIPLTGRGQNAVAYVLEIGQATSRAPHQAFDHRYYKRFNFESKPMEDYEVRDLMRRGIEYGRKYSAAWDLNVEVQRLISAINERGLVDSGDYLPRNRLVIGISTALRSAGGGSCVARQDPEKEGRRSYRQDR